MPPFDAQVHRLGKCWSCHYRSFIYPDPYPELAIFCIHCLAGCPIFGPYFRCEYEARVGWLAADLKRGGVLRPFPGDYDASPTSHGRPGAARSRAPGYGLLRPFRQVNLAEYVSRFTELTPVAAGRWKGLCPIHNEKTPSFHVSANPWRWHCFGACATGGDIIKLIGELRRIKKWPA